MTSKELKIIMSYMPDDAEVMISLLGTTFEATEGQKRIDGMTIRYIRFVKPNGIFRDQIFIVPGEALFY